MLYQGGKLCYEESLHPPAQRFLRELMATLSDLVITIVCPLIGNSKATKRALALQFLGDLLFWCGGDVDDGLKVSVNLLLKRLLMEVRLLLVVSDNLQNKQQKLLRE
jgi:hypothetical protein